ncbi:3-dehydroquinate synthase [Corynebacterium sp. sy017]|uniref:3-dehydroquinate synthase n=1 Tax=unclassified Corynebacterium TaxID=2624378 RepID=UPI0011855296|nr:3-dehydroquinate synthase [Corynebacterium sp. SY003]MBP3087696.1 3-dehydroquinate synthase [Corynebacterium sp. sy017]TSD92726.1 3-dehydroquinate synthase [Corynebacterium sp. SY003]
MTRVEVRGQSPYAVSIGRGLERTIIDFIRALEVQRVAIITQPAVRSHADNLARKCAEAGIIAVVMGVPDAEAGKTLEIAGQCWNTLGQHSFTRNDAVIGFGGGAVTDLAGFVASAWMRGIKVIHVPTTLLAMVDASVGGKTGVNTMTGKNLVGTFHEPSAVFIDLDFLDQLPKEEIIAGSAEIIKTGFIADPVIIDHYEHSNSSCLDPRGLLPELIMRSVKVKAQVVSQDLTESSLREILNYGHTFGHAVERCEDYTWRHGQAVAVGMMFIAHLAFNRGIISAELLDLHRRILDSIGLATSYSASEWDDLFVAMRHDKKNRTGRIRFVAINDIADPMRIEDATEEEMRAAYEAISGTASTESK